MPTIRAELPEVQTTIDNLTRYLETLDEDKFRVVIVEFLSTFIFKGNIKDYHGVGEHGADIIGAVDRDIDPFRKFQIVHIQVKKGRISLTKWRKNLCGQLAEVFSPSTYPRETGDDNSRRILLIYSGKLTQPASDAISNWNRKVPIPVEVLSGRQLAELMVKRYRLKLEDIKEWLKTPITL